jgi:hypothetical protein
VKQKSLVIKRCLQQTGVFNHDFCAFSLWQSGLPRGRMVNAACESFDSQDLYHFYLDTATYGGEANHLRTQRCVDNSPPPSLRSIALSCRRS